MNTEKTSSLPPLVESALTQAEAWQKRSIDNMSQREKRLHHRLSNLIKNPSDKHQLIRILDQAFRTNDPERAADQLTYILRKYGVPSFLSSHEQFLARTLQVIGTTGAEISIPLIRKYILNLIADWVVIDEENELTTLLKSFRSEGITANVNRIGEALLGEREAACRLEQYITDINNADIPYISVKISTLYAQIDPLATRQVISILDDRLTKLYREALTNSYTFPNGHTAHKFINLDMEEYRDAALTVKLLLKTLKKSEFQNLRTGITLQSYLPDFSYFQDVLLAFAKERKENGGAPLKIRLVKGANLEMEKTEAAIRGWSSAPFENKLETDAHYKLMLQRALTKENAQAVNVGIASHNIFDLAYGYCLAKENKTQDHVTFEMLNGMSPHVQRTLLADGLPVILYTPVVAKEEVNAAIAYLIRRLDENTCQGHYLRDSFLLKVGSPAWNYQKQAFIDSWQLAQTFTPTKRRIQNRLTESVNPKTDHSSFSNEPDSDFTQDANLEWIRNIKQTWCRSDSSNILKIPVAVGGTQQFEQRIIQDCRDIGQPGTPIIIAQYAQASPEDMDTAIATAKSDPDGWRTMSSSDRKLILAQAAEEIKRRRGDFIGIAASATGKTMREMDTEVSEAVDFAYYYPQSFDAMQNIETLRIQGKGVVVVVSPWNFPLAIPAGGIFAALAAGNTVILKPSSAAIPVAWMLCQSCWKAGISPKTLQFFPTKDNKLATKLVTHPDVDCVIFTGGTMTTKQLLTAYPNTKLVAETGGKNSTIVTAMADIDQAVKNVVISAFSNSGQKCSATSLLIAVESVFDNPQFARKIADAVTSLPVGYPWDTQTVIGPLIDEPGDTLSRGMRLDNKERWLVEPRQIGNDVRLWTPGVKWNVEPGSFSHTNELFGPILSIMRAEDLDEAIESANSTGFGLTAGLESLDPREQEYWMEHIKAGNLYINRPTTGAIVNRQPFGGYRMSNFGPGFKAGGPHYIIPLLQLNEAHPDKPNKQKTNLSHVNAILRMLEEQATHPHDASIDTRGLLKPELYAQAAHAGYNYYSRFHECFASPTIMASLRGQDNILRYRPRGKVAVRLHEDDTVYDIAARVLATYLTNNELVLSAPPTLEAHLMSVFPNRIWNILSRGEGITYQDDEDFAARMGFMDRIRFAHPNRVPSDVKQTASRQGIYIADHPPMIEGRIELLYYLMEQSVSTNFHRYGNLGNRFEEFKN